MKKVMLVVLLALAAPVAAVGQGQGQPEDRRERRERLEQQVRTRFLDIATARLELTADQRTRLASVLDEGARERRELARESMAVRRRLMAAAGDEATPSSTFEDLLRRMEALAQREHALQRREQERLAEFLSPRQRALFLMLRMRFNEQVRELRGRGPRG